MDTREIEPLTQEQWDHPTDVLDGYLSIGDGVIDVRLGGVASASRDVATDARALMAYLNPVAGVNGPMLFTWAHVDALRFCAARVRAVGDPQSAYAAFADECSDRIAALLPPRSDG